MLFRSGRASRTAENKTRRGCFIGTILALVGGVLADSGQWRFRPANPAPPNLIAGTLPQKQRRLVEAWAELHQAQLIADWQLLHAGRAAVPIDPLK